MHLDLQRTIVAVSSGIAPARRAIVRLSGNQTRAILRSLTHPDFPSPGAQQHWLDATEACSCTVRIDLGWNGRWLPGRVYFWPDTRSYTGEPSAELHIVGSLPILEALVERCLTLGASPAQRGEFTLRSFMAGKVDLTQAEAVLGVIEADTPRQLELALSQLGGNLSHPVRQLRSELVELIAHLEAGLDFVEEDIEFITAEQLVESLQRIADRLAAIAAQLASRGSRRRRARVVLVGLPNAGKSSLFNALLGQERAIVSDQAGTTRDAVSDTATLGELQIELIDTAGLEEMSATSPRGLAQSMLTDRLAQSDLAVFCIDASQPISPAWLQSQLARLKNHVPNWVLVGTKADLAVEPESSATWQILVSIRDATSVAALRQHLAATLAANAQALHSDALHETSIRCSGSLELARAALERAVAMVHAGEGEELVAAELRLALDDLSAVIGEVHTEDILGEIFSRFCIGK